MSFLSTPPSFLSRASVQILAALAVNVFLVIVYFVYRTETRNARRQKRELAKYH